MALTTGTRLGSYVIESPLGAGGMGEVYRAHDTKLNRDVALKVLPDLVAGDPDRLARFRREALVLASLNHPNIAHVYGFEDAGATPALVMELVDGPTLADRIAHGPIPLPEALPLARQITDALEAAHDKDIIHRDLKPANIKVRDDGTVKVLDFGLAKALDPAANSGVMALNSPTLTARATELGVILGTAAYMAPEQAKGRAVDRRADIWAFGCVLFEMLTGTRPFGGDDITETLASVLKESPEWRALPAGLPPSLERLLRRCLEKDPKRRLSAIADARLELDEAAAQPHAEMKPASAAAPAARPRWPWLLLAGVTVLWLATMAAAWRYARTTPRPEGIQFSVPISLSPTNPIGAAPAISPDGRTLAYMSPMVVGERNVLFVRALGALDARALPGTEGAGQPFWSPDSRRIGFFAEGKMKIVDLAGGAPRTVCDTAGNLGATWNGRGEIVFAKGTGQSGLGLFRVSEAGGTPALLVKPDPGRGETGFMWPEFLPDGTHVTYLAWNSDAAQRGVYVTSLDGGTPVRLLGATSQALTAAPGVLLFHRDGTVFSQPFDSVALRLSGEATRLVDNVRYSGTVGRAEVSVSANGVLAYRTGTNAGALADLVWVDRTGKVLGTVGDTRAYYQVRLSPNEKRAVTSAIDPKSFTYTMYDIDLATQVTARLTTSNSVNDHVWAPDSQTVAYEGLVNGKRDFFRRRIGSPDQTVLFESPDTTKWLDDWSRDGRYVLFHVPTPGKMFALPLDDRGEPGKPMLLTEASAAVDELHFSPDGKHIVYNTAESGVSEVWVASFPALDNRRQISPRGGGQGWWRGDGQEIFYLAPDGKVMSVGVSSDPKSGALEFRAPVLLFQSPLTRPNLNTDEYSVTRDGQRFLFIQPVRDSTSSQTAITVLVNWTSALTDR